jgi:hypothetical protein
MKMKNEKWKMTNEKWKMENGKCIEIDRDKFVHHLELFDDQRKMRM